MQHLSPGSVICFGSTRHNQFCVDTVFVVATAHPWTPDHTTGLDLDEAFTVCTAQPLTIPATTGTGCASGVCTRHPSGCPPATRVGLRLYRGATIDNPVHGMYSFVPARPAGHPNPGFARPAVRLPELINPRNRQSPRGARNLLPIKSVWQAWESLRKQILDNDLVLATYLATPPCNPTSEPIPTSPGTHC